MVFVASALVLSSGGMALAASSDWAETEGGRIRITTLAPDESGVIRGILDIDLLPGWKTYWRDPGDSGVPPSVRIDGSDNIKQVSLDFPAPERVDDGYSIWAGYTYPVALPLTLEQVKAGRSSRLEADVFLGLCETICIPFQTRFTVEIDPDDEPNSFEVARVEDAHARIPEPAGDDFAISDAVVSESGEMVTFSVVSPDPNAETDLFISGPMGWYFDIPQHTDDGSGQSVFTVTILDRPEGASLSGQAIRLVVTTAARSMETEIVVP